MKIDSMSKPIQKTRSRKFNEEVISNPDELKKKEPYRGILGNGKTNDRIKIAMWNVNGIRSVLSKNALNNFIKQYAPDILCINETKINQEQFDKSPIELKGYSGYWNFCKVSAGYSGVAIFSRFLPLSIFEDLEEPAFSQEGRVLTLQYQHFYLVAVYIPSAGDKKLERLHYKTQQYEKAFHKYCESLKAKGKGVIVCGDMNVCHEDLDIHPSPLAHKHPGFTQEERISFRNFLNLGWIDTFRKLNPTLRQYTWWRIQHGNRERNIGKRLDYFLVNKNFYPVVAKSEVLGDVKGSDHCPIYLIIDLSKLKQSKNQTLEKPIDEKLAETHVETAASQVKKDQTAKSEKKNETQCQKTLNLNANENSTKKLRENEIQNGQQNTKELDNDRKQSV